MCNVAQGFGFGRAGYMLHPLPPAVFTYLFTCDIFVIFKYHPREFEAVAANVKCQSRSVDGGGAERACSTR